MKKVLKNVLKWLICIVLTFTVVFSIAQYELIAGGIYIEIAALRGYEKYEEIFGEGNLEEMIKWHDEITNEQFLSDDINEEDIMKKLYSQYPAGVARTMGMFVVYMVAGETTVISLILGVIMGSAIYMLLDKDKKGIKAVVPLYILSFVILGFVQGFLNIYGEKLTLLDKWMFPDEYIIPVSIAFALVVAVRFFRQKDIANKLNEKLKERKEKTNKSS